MHTARSIGGLAPSSEEGAPTSSTLLLAAHDAYEEALELLERLLCVDPAGRPTAAEALASPFLAGPAAGVDGGAGAERAVCTA